MSRRRKKKGVLSGVVAAILGVVIFICLLGLAGVFSMGRITEKSYIKEMIQEVDLSSLTGGAMEEAEKYLVVFGLPEDTIDKVMESDAVSSLISDYASDCMDYIIYGKETSGITEDDLAAAFEKGLDEVSGNAGLSISGDQKQMLVLMVKQGAGYVVSAIPTPKQMADSFDQSSLGVLRTLFAPSTKVIFLAIILCMMLLIGLVRGSFSDSLMWTGIAALPAGLITLLIGAAGKGGFADIAGSGQAGKIIYAAGSGLFAGVVRIGLILAAVGIVLLIVQGIMKSRTTD